MNLNILAKKINQMVDDKFLNIIAFQRFLRIIIESCSIRSKKDLAFLKAIRFTTLTNKQIVKMMQDAEKEKDESDLKTLEDELEDIKQK